MKRVMIVGGPGSGKSTLARQLGAATGLPVFHMDHIHWMPGWVERDREEKDRLTEAVHRSEAWIFEGAHSRTYAGRVARADTFIWLDAPLPLRMWRVIRRAATGLGRSRPDMPPDCPERLDRGFLELLGFIWRTRKTARAKLQAIAEGPPAHLTVYRLRNLREVRAFLAGLPTPVGSSERGRQGAHRVGTGVSPR